MSVKLRTMALRSAAVLLLLAALLHMIFGNTLAEPLGDAAFFALLLGAALPRERVSFAARSGQIMVAVESQAKCLYSILRWLGRFLRE